MFITPNRLTLLRFVLAALIPYVIMRTHSVAAKWIALILFIVASLTDIYDGVLARRSGRITNFGKIADPIADKVLILSAMFTYVYLGLYSIWLIIPIAVREVLVTSVRIKQLVEGRVIAAEQAGKVKTVLQFVSLFATFLYLCERDHFQFSAFWTPSLSAVFFLTHYFFITLALALTLYSGWSFFAHQRKGVT